MRLSITCLMRLPRFIDDDLRIFLIAYDKGIMEFCFLSADSGPYQYLIDKAVQFIGCQGNNCKIQTNAVNPKVL